MKILICFHHRLWLNALVVLTLLAGGRLHAADVQKAFIVKSQNFVQTGTGAPVAQGASNYLFQAFLDATDGALTNVVITRPNNSTVTVNSGYDGYEYKEAFASQSALDAAFPGGTNTFTLGTVNDGQRTLVLNLAGDTYPTTPHFTNYPATQSVDPELAFTLAWDPISGATTNDFVQLSVRTQSDQGVLESPSPGQPGALNGTATAFVIPARKLRPGQTYTVELIVAHFTDYNPTEYPGAVGVAGYLKQLKMNLVTTGTQTGNPPGNFELVFSFSQGSFVGTNGTISFPQALGYFDGLFNISGDTNYPATVIFNGPPGSGITNLTNLYVGSNNGESAFYATPSIFTSTNGGQPGDLVSSLPPGGIYSVNYKGSNSQFNLLDPLAAQQQVLIVPTVVLSASNTVQEIRWTYRNTNGVNVGPQPYMDHIEIRVDGIVGGRLYDAGNENSPIPPATTNHLVNQPVPWTNVSKITLLFKDTAGNTFESSFARASAPVQITTTNLPPTGRGTNYSFILSATGGSQQFTNWTLLGGFLPSGVFLTEATGELVGVPGESGAFPFTVRVTDSNGASTNKNLTLTVLSGPFPTPVLTEVSLTASNQFVRLQFTGVSNQTYTIETSTNLVQWTPVTTFQADSNLLSLVDPESLATHSKLFYRARIGRLFQNDFNFHHFATGGQFGAGITPSVSFPISVNGYAAVLITFNDGYPPDPTNVLFSGPAGSALSNSPASTQNPSIGGNDNLYQSPTISSPATGPAGLWSVNYAGTNFNFTMPDPQAASRLVIPVPTVTLSGGLLQSVSWVYKNPATGAVFSQPPAHMTDIKVQVDENFVRVYESENLPPATSAHTLPQSVTWSAVTMIHMVYNDTLGNHYVISYPRP